MSQDKETKDEDRWTAISMRFSSIVMSAEAIEEALGETASDKAEIGELISRRSVQAGKHECSMCVFDCPVPRESDTQLHWAWAGAFLDQHGAAIVEMGEACQVDVFMSFASGSGQGGFALASSTLATLARARANVYVSLYPQEAATSAPS